MSYGMASPMSGMASTNGASLRGNATGDIIPKGYRKGQLQQYTPEQMQLFQQGFQHLGPNSYLSRLAGGDESMFEEMEAPAWRQFQEAQGQMGSRFSGMGMGAQRGSGFKNAANQASSDFAMQLKSQRQDLKRQAMQDLMSYSQMLLGQKPYENFMVKKAPKKKQWWEEALGAISPMGGDLMSGGTENSQNFLNALMAFA